MRNPGISPAACEPLYMTFELAMRQSGRTSLPVRQRWFGTRFLTCRTSKTRQVGCEPLPRDDASVTSCLTRRCPPPCVFANASAAAVSRSHFLMYSFRPQRDRTIIANRPEPVETRDVELRHRRQQTLVTTESWNVRMASVPSLISTPIKSPAVSLRTISSSRCRCAASADYRA